MELQYIGHMETNTLRLPVATSDFVTRKNHGEFMSERIDRLCEWVQRGRWPGTFSAWVVEDLTSAAEHVKNNRWNDAHEMLVGALLGVQFTNDHVDVAAHYTEQLATFQQWVHTIKTDIQKLVP